MATPTATKPDRVTGLPPGVFVGPLKRRLVACLVDAVVPVVLLVVLYRFRDDSVAGVTNVLCPVLLVAWALLVWWMFATRAAGPGMRLMKLQLVGFTNGRPIGWARFFVRTLVLVLLAASIVGLLVMLVYLLRHPRYQGWHDLAAGSVVIVERPLAPRTKSAPTTSAKADGSQAAEAPPKPAPPPSPVPRPSSAAPSVHAPPPAPRSDPTRRAVADATGEPPRGRTWMAVLDDGREVVVRGLVLLGRNPQPRPGEEGAELLKVADESRTVSKSHLALGLREDSVFVVDRGSTNGSVVTNPDGARIRCLPEEPVSVAEGAVVSMGDHWFKVDRR